MTQTTITEMLHEFHTRPGVDVSAPNGPTLDVPGLIEREGYLREEFQELVEAHAAGDLVKFADALGDIEYVVHGTAWRTGIGWSIPPASNEFTPTVPTLNVGGLRIKLTFIGAAISDLSKALDTHDLVRFGNALKQVDSEVRAVARRTGIPLEDVLAEIHASNMTKRATPGDGKAEKGPEYRSPDVAGVLLAAGYTPR